MRLRAKAGLVVVAALVVAALLAIGEAAAVSNGKIAFVSTRGEGVAIYTMSPDGSDVTLVSDAAFTSTDPAWSWDGTKIAFASVRLGADYEIFTMNADGSGLTQVTDNDVHDLEPSWSPDGTKLAFMSDRDDNPDIYTIGVEGTGEQRLTTSPAEDASPAWSPDGARIAWATDRHGVGELYVMGADGSFPTRLTSDGHDDRAPNWSSDGTRIAYTSDLSVAVIDADGTGRTAFGPDMRDPDWAPNGTRLVFQDVTFGQHEIVTADPAGGSRTRLTNHGAEDFDADWQPVDFVPPSPPTARVSVTSAGAQGNNMSRAADVSEGGRYVVFHSYATNLATGDTDALADVFRHDRQTGQTVLVSTTASGAESDGDSMWPSISGDGRYVAFESTAQNILPTLDDWRGSDIYVKDMVTGEMQIASHNGVDEGNQPSYAPSMSRDGNHVAYYTAAGNLAVGDTNLMSDIYRWDRTTGTNVLASRAPGGAVLSGPSMHPAISADGSVVAFTTSAPNADPAGNSTWNVYARNVETGAVTRASVALSGQPDSTSGFSGLHPIDISDDGTRVAFESSASNLLAAGVDGNGSPDVFVRDLTTSTTHLASVAAGGGTLGSSGFGSNAPSISGDGSRVVFDAWPGFVPDDTGGSTDVYVRDIDAGTTFRATRGFVGQANNNSGGGRLSGDGRTLVFDSVATNLVLGDTNGVADVFAKRLPPSIIVTVAGTIVNSTDDANDGACTSAHCSLREAINASNATPGVQTIGFSILTGFKTIRPATALPFITDAVVIDGTTQPGFTTRPLIELDGSAVEGAASGLVTHAGETTVRGLIVNRFNRNGIEVTGGGGSVFEGNWIGLDASGTMAAGNGWDGIALQGVTHKVGGTTPLQRNVISGQTGVTRAGVLVAGTDITVSGNAIGTNVGGSAPVANYFGVRVAGSGNTIGGVMPGAGNLVSGNLQSGVQVNFPEGDGANNRIEGNVIGLDARRAAPLGNGTGIRVTSDDPGTVIGGSPSAKNVVAGNANGIVLNGAGSGTIIRSNYIGTTPEGVDFGNAGAGILVTAPDVIIGGRVAGQGNTIMYNGVGVVVADREVGPSTADIAGNAIARNDDLGIELAGSPGVTANDPLDADTGPNGLQNFPIVTNVVRSAESLQIDGRLESEAGGNYAIDLYWSSTCDPAGNGEGRRYIGTGDTSTDAGGSGTFTLVTGTVVPIGAVITATATRNGQTSEFSGCTSVTGTLDPGTLRVVSTFLDSVDPAYAYAPQSWQLLRETCAGVVAYDDAPGAPPGTLVPDLAETLPTVTDGGRTYAFILRPNYRFQPSGSDVDAEAIERAFERLFAPGSTSPGRAIFDDIVGVEDYHAGIEETISGISASDEVLEITLERPAGDFLARMALPFACAVPPGTPLGRLPFVEAAGPYYIASYDHGDFVRLVENPAYTGPRPHTFDGIEYSLVDSGLAALARVEGGAADYTAGPVPVAERARLNTAYGPGSPAAAVGAQRYFETDSALVRNLALNTERPLFADARVRRALNTTLRRTEMAAAFGETPWSQYTPDNVAGFRAHDIYSRNPGAAEDAAGRALVEAAGAVGANAVVYTCTTPQCGTVAAGITASLAPLGITTTIQTFPRLEQIERTSTRGEPFDISVMGWGADYLDPSNFINTLMHGSSIRPEDNVNWSYFDDPYWNARMAAAKALSGEARHDAYFELERDLLEGPAPMAVYAMGRRFELFSEPIGCHRFHPLFGVSLGALCSRAPVTAEASLTADAATVPAGVAEVPLANIPVEQLEFGSSVNSAPLADIPLADIPLADIPLADIPLADIGLLDPALRAALDQVLLSSIPLATPGGWEAVLELTQYAGRPLQTVTLGQVLALQPLPPEIAPPANSTQEPIRLLDVERGNSVLGKLSTVSIALGGTPLQAIGVPGPSADPLANWCALLSGPPISCSANSAGSLQGVSLIGLDLRGVPLADIPLADIPLRRIPLADIPLADIPLADINIAHSPLADIPLADIDLAASPLADIPLADIPLADIPLADIPLADIANVGALVTCPPGVNCIADLTLGEAAAAGLLDPAATLGDLGSALALYTLGDLGIYGDATIGDVWAALGDLSLGQLLRALIPPASYPWEELQLDELPLQELASTGGTLRFSANIRLAGTAVPAGRRFGTDAAVRLPDGWQFVPASSVLRRVGGGEPERELADPDIVDGVASWTVDVESNADYELSFEMRAGLTLGLSTPASASVVAEGGSTAASDEVSVQVGDTFEDNDTPAQAVEIAPDTLIFSFVAQGDDLDYFSFPAPPPGSRISVHLSHLSSDADLVLYSPTADTLRPSAPLRAPAPGPFLADDGAQLAHLAQVLQPERLQDIPLVQGRHVAGVSINRETADEEVSTISAYEGGQFLIQVSPYNRERSDSAYVLRVQVFAAPPEVSCAAPAFGFPNAGVAGTLPGTLPTGVDTVFLVNRERFGDSYGEAAETALAGIRLQLPALGALGHNAFLAEIDGDPEIAAAYAEWDLNPCSARRANDVVREIGELLDRLRAASPTLRHIVLVGGDRIVPFARIRDGARIANERDFASEFPQGSSLRGALAGENVLSDDVYGTLAPTGVDRPLYVPTLAVGRLVETPGEIAAAVTQFVSFGGRLDPATKSALTTGYDFLSDGASGIEAQLAQLVPAGASTLLNDNWNSAALETALLGATPPWLASVNAHFDPRRALPATDNAANTQADLFDTTRITNAGANKLLGTLFFSMGCHAGLSVEDVAIGAAYADWTQTLAAQRGSLLGNTGYGYGDTSIVAYSEELMRLFAQELRRASNIGHALVAAKQRYLASLVVRGVYDEKAAAEATFYGLPMYEVGAAAAAAPSGLSPSGTEPATGLPAHRVDFEPSLLPSGPSPRLLRVNTTNGRGSYWAVDGRAQATHYRPIQPLFETEVTADDPTLIAHGALVTRLESVDQAVDPVFSRPTIDLAARESELAFGDVAWPSRIQGIGSYEAEGERHQLLTLVPGQFFSDSTIDAAGVGTQRLFTDIGVDVVYSRSTDFVAPELTRVDGAIVGGAAAFTVCADDPAAGGDDVERVVVLFRDESAGATNWRRAELVRTPGTCLWTGGGPATGTRIEYLVQALDDAGNVGISSFKAHYYEALPQPAEPAGFDVELTGTPGDGGWYTTPVRVELAATGGSAIEYSLDGGPLRLYDGPFTISSTGVHTIDYASSNGIAGQEIVAVDVSDPTIEITEPAGGTLYDVGQVVRADFACADAGAGIRSCVGSTADGALLDTTTGEHTLTVTATDAAGHVTVATRTYNVGWPFTGFFGFPDPPAATTVTAPQTVPLAFQLGGNRGRNPIAPGYPRSQQITCGSAADATGGTPTQTPGGFGVKFALGYYVYLWKTEKAWRGTCRQFVLKLNDGSTHRVNFRFR